MDFLDRFSKNIQMSNFMKIHSVGAELFHADGRTDGQTSRILYSIFKILRTRLKMEGFCIFRVFVWMPIFLVFVRWCRDRQCVRFCST